MSLSPCVYQVLALLRPETSPLRLEGFAVAQVSEDQPVMAGRARQSRRREEKQYRLEQGKDQDQLLGAYFL